MFKYITVVFAIIAYTMAKPSAISPVALSAEPIFAAAPAVVTATSSQYQVRNHHAYAAPLVAAPAAYAAVPFATSYAVSNSWNLPYTAATYVI